MALDIVMESINWKENDIQAFSAGNGKAALKIIEDNPIDIVITDIKMPEMDGLELIRRINNINRGIACIVMSSYNEFDLVRAAMQLGAYDYIFKPTAMPDDIRKVVLETYKKICRKQEENSDMPLNIADRKEAFQFLINNSELSDEQKSKLIRQIGIETSGIVCVIKIRLLHYSARLKNSFLGDYDAMGFTLDNILNEVANNYLNCEVLGQNFHEYIVVAWQVNQKKLKSFINEFTVDVNKYYQMDSHMGISVNSRSFIEIYKLNQQANLAEERAEILGQDYIGYSDNFEDEFSQPLQLALTYIGQNLIHPDNLSLRNVAEYAKVSSSYLSHQFKAETGMNFIDYITDKKLEKAKELYCTTDKKIYEIAEMLGYSDWHYLYTLYKNRYGHSLSKEMKK